MASISIDRNGLTRIAYFIDEKRKTFHLGRIRRAGAETMKRHLEAIITSRRFGIALEPATIAWLQSIDDSLYQKFAHHGLLMPRRKSSLAGYLDEFISRLDGVKPSTTLNVTSARNRLVEYFGGDKPIDSIQEVDAPRWVKWMSSKRDRKLSRSTIGRDIRTAKRFFEAAKQDGYFETNPFAGLKSMQQVNSARLVFITRDVIQRVIDACPSSQLRLIIALSRYGGLRCPSEHYALKWRDVNWEQGKFWVTSPKTEHHPGRDGRWVPIFPELREYMDQAFAEANDGAVDVVSWQPKPPYLRRLMERAISVAGLTRWERLFQNLRASRETELAAEYPLHVAAAWIGNTAVVAAKHYLQVREEDFARATGMMPAARAVTSGQDSVGR